MARMKVFMIDVGFQFYDLFQFVSQYLTDVGVYCSLFGFFFLLSDVWQHHFEIRTEAGHRVSLIYLAVFLLTLLIMLVEWSGSWH